MQEKKENLQEKEKLEKIEKMVKNANTSLEKEKNLECTYRIVLGKNNKTLYYTKKTQEKLEEWGVKTPKNNYISYKKTPLSYNSVLAIFTTFSDVFRMQENTEKEE